MKYGIISDDKFYERAKEFILLKNTKNEYFTIDEYKTKLESNQVDKDGNAIALYCNDLNKEDAYIEGALKREYDVLILDDVLDAHFLNALEMKVEKLRFKRVDSEPLEKIIDKGIKAEVVLSEDEKKKVEEVFKPLIGNNIVQIEALPVDDLPVSIVQTEFMRRYTDMSKVNGQANMMPLMYNLVVNGNHPIIQKVVTEEGADLAKQLVDLALLSQGMLSGKDLTQFIHRSIERLK